MILKLAVMVVTHGRALRGPTPRPESTHCGSKVEPVRSRLRKSWVMDNPSSNRIPCGREVGPTLTEPTVDHSPARKLK
jgi:hypothetical protein